MLPENHNVILPYAAPGKARALPWMFMAKSIVGSAIVAILTPINFWAFSSFAPQLPLGVVLGILVILLLMFGPGAVYGAALFHVVEKRFAATHRVQSQLLLLQVINIVAGVIAAAQIQSLFLHD